MPLTANRSAPTTQPENAQRRYTAPAAWMHGATAVVLLGAAVLGACMVDLPMSVKRLQWFNWHKWAGMTVVPLVLARLAWRMLNPPPMLPASTPPWQLCMAALTHTLLYLLMLAVPLLGWAYSSATGFPVTWLGLLVLPDWVPRSRELAAALRPIHALLAWSLVALIALHVLAALKHHFIDRDGLLSRMRPW